jgi:hypothetical protein
MTRYEVHFQGPGSAGRIIWDLERLDDEAALTSALEACHNQRLEVWEGQRKIAAIFLSVEPRLFL